MVVVVPVQNNIPNDISSCLTWSRRCDVSPEILAGLRPPPGFDKSRFTHLVGAAYISPGKDEEDKGFTPEELAGITDDQILCRPIYLEHDNRYPIGSIHSFYVDAPQRTVYIGAQLQSTGERGCQVSEMVRRGELSSLSIGLIKDTANKTNERCNKYIRETSLTDDPKIPGCQIYEVYSKKAQTSATDINNNMEDPHPSSSSSSSSSTTTTISTPTSSSLPSSSSSASSSSFTGESLEPSSDSALLEELVKNNPELSKRFGVNFGSAFSDDEFEYHSKEFLKGVPDATRAVFMSMQPDELKNHLKNVIPRRIAEHKKAEKIRMDIIDQGLIDQMKFMNEFNVTDKQKDGEMVKDYIDLMRRPQNESVNKIVSKLVSAGRNIKKDRDDMEKRVSQFEKDKNAAEKDKLEMETKLNDLKRTWHEMAAVKSEFELTKKPHIDTSSSSSLPPSTISTSTAQVCYSKHADVLHNEDLYNMCMGDPVLAPSDQKTQSETPQQLSSENQLIKENYSKHYATKINEISPGYSKELTNHMLKFNINMNNCTDDLLYKEFSENDELYSSLQPKTENGNWLIPDKKGKTLTANPDVFNSSHILDQEFARTYSHLFRGGNKQ